MCGTGGERLAIGMGGTENKSEFGTNAILGHLLLVTLKLL
jgi:enolase